MEELEDNIIKHYKSDSTNVHLKVCLEDAQLCVRSSLKVKESDEL